MKFISTLSISLIRLLAIQLLLLFACNSKNNFKDLVNKQIKSGKQTSEFIFFIYNANECVQCNGVLSTILEQKVTKRITAIWLFNGIRKAEAEALGDQFKHITNLEIVSNAELYKQVVLNCNNQTINTQHPFCCYYNMEQNSFQYFSLKDAHAITDLIQLISK